MYYIIGCENSLLVPSVKALVLSHWSQTGNLMSDKSTKKHNLFTYSGEESSRMLPSLRQYTCQQIIGLDCISLGFLVYIDAVCRL